MKDKNERLSKGEIWEKHLYYSLIPMVKMYLNRHVLERYIEFLEKFNDSPNTKEVLSKLAALHIQSLIINEQGNFSECIDNDEFETLKENCIQLNKQLRPEMVALTFTCPFSDQSFGALGKSTLQPYKEFMKGVTETPDCYGKPNEWKYLYRSKM
jgi:hypothetical protein